MSTLRHMNQHIPHNQDAQSVGIAQPIRHGYLEPQLHAASGSQRDHVPEQQGLAQRAINWVVPFIEPFITAFFYAFFLFL